MTLQAEVQLMNVKIVPRGELVDEDLGSRWPDSAKQMVLFLPVL